MHAILSSPRLLAGIQKFHQSRVLRGPDNYVLKEPIQTLLAVVRDSTGTSVFRVQDQVAQRVPVQVDRVIGERVMVHPGALSPGDQVVYAGMTRLVDGDTVEVR